MELRLRDFDIERFIYMKENEDLETSYELKNHIK